MASRAMLVDQALAEYGSEAQPVRNLMKQALDQSHDLFWRGADADPAQLKVEVAFKRWGQVASALDALDPKTPAQKDALAGSRAPFDRSRCPTYLPIAPIACSSDDAGTRKRPE
jgi:hypothetical protein